MARVDQGLIIHPNAKASWRTVRLSLPAGTLRTVLEVQTDLMLNPEHPDHDAMAYNSLVEAITEYLAKNDSVDAADVDHIQGE
jgi:hypothetical protein